MAQELPERARESSAGSEDAAPRSKRPIPWDLVAACIASLGLLATIWAVDYIPTHDGPQHIYLAHVSNHFADAGAPYRSFYEPGRPLTALGFQLLYAPLESFLPWRVALRIVLSIIVLVWAWGARSFIVAVEPRRRVLGLLSFAAALQWSLYMGFFAYVLATGVGFFVLATAAQRWPWTWKRKLAIAGLLLAQAVFHVFAAQVTGLLLLLVVACRTERGQRARGLLWLGAMGAPAMAIAAYTAGLLTDPSRVAMLASMGTAWPSWTQRITRLADLFAAGPPWKTWPFVLIAVAGLVDGARRLRARNANPLDLPLFLGAVALFGLALFLPFHVRGRWEFLSPRFIPFAMVTATALLGVDRLPAQVRLRGATAVVMVFVAASLLWSRNFHTRLAEVCGDALGGLDARVDRHGIRLPIVLDTKCNASGMLAADHIKFVEPLLNLGALYAVEQGGVVPYVFALQPEIHPFVLTEAGLAKFPPIPDRRELWVRAMTTSSDDERTRTVQTLASFGPWMEDVMVAGRAEDARAFLARGYVPDALQGGMLIGRFVGCPASIDLSFPEGGSHEVVVEYGWYPSERRAWGGVGRAKGSSARRALVALPGCPCGSIWVRVVEDRDGSGAMTPGDGFCEGADARGVLTVEVTRSSPRLACTIAP